MVRLQSLPWWLAGPCRPVHRITLINDLNRPIDASPEACAYRWQLHTWVDHASNSNERLLSCRSAQPQATFAKFVLGAFSSVHGIHGCFTPSRMQLRISSTPGHAPPTCASSARRLSGHQRVSLGASSPHSPLTFLPCRCEMFATTLLLLLERWTCIPPNWFRTLFRYLGVGLDNLEAVAMPSNFNGSRRHSTSSSSSDEECLSDLILRTRCNSAIADKREFFPNNCIEPLITRKHVMKELGLTEDNLQEGYAAEVLKFILNRGRRLFAILIDINLTDKKLFDAARQFMDSSFGDESLPVTKENEDKVPFLKDRCDRRSRWETRLIRRFRHNQFEYLAPVFTSDKLDMDLDPLYILPFINQYGGTKTGGFGEVYQVDIHPSHHQNPILTVSSILSL